MNDPRAIGDQQMPPHGLMGLVETTDPNRWIWGVSFLVLALILSGIGILYWQKRRAKLKAAANNSSQPQVSFIQILAGIAWPESIDQQEEFVYQLSFHLRAALERLSFVSFTDMTFRELQQSLTDKRAESLPINSHDLLNFFELADQIKFQRKRVSDEEMTSQYATLQDWFMIIDQQLYLQENGRNQNQKQTIDDKSSTTRLMA